MKLKIFMILSIFYLLDIISVEAQTFSLQGKVTDQNMNPIEFATVLVSKQGKMTLTSLKGEFSMTLLSTDTVSVKFSMIGYKTKTNILRSPKGNQKMLVILYPIDQMLDEVQVSGERLQTGQTQNLKIKDYKTTPSANGNAVENLVQSQAGVSTHNELSSQYNVRGGSFNENIVYINNVEIYRPFLIRSAQQEGLSIINPDMVEKIGFSTGGFEAKYGDKMASALDITYKTPRQFSGTLSTSLLGASAYIGFGNKKISWSNGLRYQTTKSLLGSLETTGEYMPNFIDYQTYLSFTPNPRLSIDFIGNISGNHFNFIPKDRETKFGTLQDVTSFRVYFDGQEKDLFRTYFGTISLKYNLSSNTNFSLISSAFSTNEQEKYDIQGQYWLTDSETSDNLGIGTFFEHARNYLNANVESIKLMLNHKNNHHNFEGAITVKNEQIKENSVEYEMRDSAGYSVPHTGRDLNMIYSLNVTNELKANRIETYLQDNWRFSSGGDTSKTFFTLNYGLRFSYWNFNRESILSPRISLGIIPAFNDQLIFRIATGLYYQSPFFKELRDTTTINGVTYATLNRNIKSQRSIHFIAGMDYRFKLNRRPFKFSAEAYYKALSNLVPYSINNVKIVYDGNNVASGYVTGIDLKLFGEFVPETDSWISLSLMKTNMNLNGHSIPLPTDQRFALNLFLTDYFPHTQRWKMSLKLAYIDGFPFTPPHRELETTLFRAPAYRRADIGMTYKLLDNEKNNEKHFFRDIWIGIDCLNLLDIDNVNSYYWITDISNQQYAIPNYLTRRQFNIRFVFNF